MDALCEALEALDRDDDVRAIVVTGNQRAFAAGADIGEMADATPVDMLRSNRIGQWDRVRKIGKPVIAAVNGWCLGGGCELAMTLDLIIAGESARFGQPEINIGVIPGAGGTQRLTRAIGKARAMEMILTGEPMGAREARDRGLVARVVPDELVVEDALALAAQIATKSPVALRLAKEAVNAAYETDLTDGAGPRAPALLPALRVGGPEGGDGRLPGEAEPRLHGPMSLGNPERPVGGLAVRAPDGRRAPAARPRRSGRGAWPSPGNATAWNPPPTRTRCGRDSRRCSARRTSRRSWPSPAARRRGSASSTSAGG